MKKENVTRTAIQYLVLFSVSYLIAVLITKDTDPMYWSDKVYFSFVTMNILFPICKLLK